MLSSTCSTRSRRLPSCVWTCSTIAALLSLRRLRLRRRLVARLRLACVVARLERMSAPAGGDGVGVANRETFAKRRFRVVDLRTAQVLETISIHEDLHAAALEDLVVVAALGVETHAVRKPFAPARLNKQPQVLAGLLLGLQEFLQFRGSLIRDSNHREKPSRAILGVARKQVKHASSAGPGTGDQSRMRLISSGPLVPGPWSRTISYAHNLPNRGIAHQFPEFLSGQGLRRVAVGVYGAQEAARGG